jgi:hypothetical protein
VNVQEYISSGAIEACIMGLADEQDWKELDQMAALYPEVKELKETIEKEQESQHLAATIPLPLALKERILQSLPFEKPKEKNGAPVIHLSENNTNSKPLVVPMVPTPKPVKWLQRAIAVSVLLLMGSIILNFYFYSKAVSSRKDYTTLLAQQSSLTAKNEAMEASLKTIKSPEVKHVVMEATGKMPGAMATVYWDTRTKDVYLMVNNLPQHSPDKQYQLWAIVNGKPIDAGMLESSDPDKMLLKMHNIPEAQAFAITLEKKGGSPTPDMEAMYVLGKV